MKDDFFERILANTSDEATQEKDCYYLKLYKNIIACACAKSFRLGGVRETLFLQSFKQALQNTPLNDTVNLSVVGSGGLFETLLLVAFCFKRGYRKISLDLIDQQYDEQTLNTAHAALRDFKRLLKDNGITLRSPHEKNTWSSLAFMTDSSNPELFLRIYGNANNRSLKEMYGKENQSRILVAFDFVEAYYNPFPVLKPIRDGIGEGSHLLLVNKHLSEAHLLKSKKYLPKDICHFYMKKEHNQQWHVVDFNSVDDKQNTQEFKYESRLSYFKEAAKSGMGPTPDILDRNQHTGPFADWYRAPLMKP